MFGAPNEVRQKINCHRKFAVKLKQCPKYGRNTVLMRVHQLTLTCAASFCYYSSFCCSLLLLLLLISATCIAINENTALYVFPSHNKYLHGFHVGFVNPFLQYGDLGERRNSARTVYICCVDCLYPALPPTPLC
jgi:hypothetical protein